MTVSQLKKEEKLNLQSLTWGELTWINIEHPTEKETEYLAQNYPFHPLDLDDCLSRIQRPKIDKYKDYLFLVFLFPVFHKEARVTRASQLSVFIGPNYLITLHKGELKPLVKLFKECEIDEESRQENFNEGSGYLLYRIIDRLVDYCIPISNKMLDNIEDVEDEVFSNTRRSQIKEISVLRRDIISFRRIIWPMRAVIGSLEPNVRRFTKMDLSVYFGDTVDHLDRIWDALDEYKELIEGLNDTHDSLMTNRTNTIIRLLTIISTILLPTTLIASIWGMNIGLPFQNSSHSFIYIVLIMAGIIGGMFYFFRRKKWL
ncbi:MAG: magnesium/cobalt transporter CorA [Candidatus Eisenbacteria sp.]|nr:magnesium/cobalt transporter CorA [Candidatus Eisenbacteria bacterium]